MVRKQTGVTFKANKFRELNYCVCCGKMCKIPFGFKCEECLLVNLIPCEMCEILLKDGIHKHYSYDSQDYKRDQDIEQYASKERMKEFLEEVEVHNKYSDTLCRDCQEWEKRAKDICWLCDNDFSNSREHYKLNGNMCLECSAQFI